LAVATDTQRALAFLQQNRHPADASVACERHVELALEARSAKSWAAAVPWSVFCEAVLPPGCLDEPRDDWRATLRPYCAKLVSETRNTAEAALVLNEAVWELLGVHYEPGKTPKYLAPLTVMEHGAASCSGLSLFLVACCRSVGVPARVAGVGDWGDGSGNHVWVEIWSADGWHALGACEPTALDDTWFMSKLRGPAAPRVYASSQCTADDAACTFPVPWAPGRRLPAEDVTGRYRGPQDS